MACITCLPFKHWEILLLDVTYDWPYIIRIRLDTHSHFHCYVGNNFLCLSLHLPTKRFFMFSWYLLIDHIQIKMTHKIEKHHFCNRHNKRKKWNKCWTQHGHWLLLFDHSIAIWNGNEMMYYTSKLMDNNVKSIPVFDSLALLHLSTWFILGRGDGWKFKQHSPILILFHSRYTRFKNTKEKCNWTQHTTTTINLLGDCKSAIEWMQNINSHMSAV